MVDVSIESLISMAQGYVNREGVDKDQSGTINSDSELNLLLAGTGASSIEDLMASDIREKIVERDTEKVFTTFMATDNQEQAEMNMELLGYSIKTISATYGKIFIGLKKIEQLSHTSKEQLDELKGLFDIGSFGQEAVNEVVYRLEKYKEITDETLKNLDEVNEYYKETTGQDFPPIKEKEKFLEFAINTLYSQINILKTGAVPIERIRDEIQKGFEQTMEALTDIDKLIKQYKRQRTNDIIFLTKLLDCQHQFLEEGKYSNEERQAYSKDFLSELIEDTSPMTRNFVIQQAERVYHPENDPTKTGISQNNANSNIKRSSYKTPTEIYTLRGNNVFVSDYSGKVLRTETLDPSVHTKFFE